MFSDAMIDLVKKFQDQIEDSGDSRMLNVLRNTKKQALLQSMENGVHLMESPLQRMEHVLHGWVSFTIVPLFALANAGIPIDFGRLGEILLQPVTIGVIAGLGSSGRVYRTFFLEEIGKDYVRTARAKGVPETRLLFRHVLKNAMVPILTGVVVVIPTLFMGSLIMESFFGIPGLGSYTIEAIQNQDFAIVRAMVFLGSVLYILGLLLTDISYTLVDPRIRLS